MTNTIRPDLTGELNPELRALAPIGTIRRPVKVVEHPTFRAARARLDARMTVVRLRVVALNGASPAPPDACTCPAATLERS